MKRLFAFALLGMAAAATGCAPYGYYSWHDGYGRHHRWWHATGARPIFAVSFHPAEDDDHDAIEAAEETPVYVDDRIPHQPPRITPPDPEHVKFDMGAALAAIHAIDLSGCVDRGAPRGYGHARVTFADDGHATTVLIDAPPGMTKDAVACVGEKLGHATAPEFDGAPMTVGSSYLVR